MEQEGIKKRIEQAFRNKEFIRLVFKYPEFSKRTFKKGYVMKVFEDSFDFSEIYDGHSTYSYAYIVEILAGNPNKEGDDNGKND